MVVEQDQINVFTNAFNKFFKGNASAVSLALMLIEVSHAWDDLIDGDEVSKDDINKVFKYLIFDIPTNPVYRAIPSMPDHLLNVFLRWRDATQMETEGDPDLEKTYMLRAGLYDMFSLIAFYMYGDEWAQEIGPEIRKLYGETLDSLKGEFHA